MDELRARPPGAGSTTRNGYLHAYETGSETRSGIEKWLGFYNRLRPHSSLGGVSPDAYHEQYLERSPDKGENTLRTAHT